MADGCLIGFGISAAREGREGLNEDDVCRGEKKIGSVAVKTVKLIRDFELHDDHSELVITIISPATQLRYLHPGRFNLQL